MAQEMGQQYHYITGAFFIREDAEGPTLHFRNGERPMALVNRAIKMCGMQIKRDEVNGKILLEVASNGN